MEANVDEDAILRYGKEISKGIETEADLADFSKLPKMIVVKTLLDAELTDHLGHDQTTPQAMAPATIAMVNLRNPSRVKMVISTWIRHRTVAVASNQRSSGRVNHV